VVVGVIQVASPLAFWWLDGASVFAMGLAVIAAIYIGSPWPTDAGTSSPSKPP
jgi:hypothetical protein